MRIKSAILALLLLGAFEPVVAQPSRSERFRRDSSDLSSRRHRPQKTFFTRRDLGYSALALAGSAALSHFDVRIAHWSQRDAVQGSTARQDFVDQVTQVNEGPLTIAAAGTYLIGRVSGSETVADIGLHTTESMVLTIAVSELLRGPIGRVRPRASPGDQYNFEFGGGFTKFEDRSFPSLHSSAAFAAASSLVGEIRERRPDAVKFAAPVLYTAALLPGFSRIHLDEHWASDVAAGAFVGALLGSRVVSYAHSHRRSKLDRFMLGATVVPSGDGRTLVMVSSKF